MSKLDFELDILKIGKKDRNLVIKGINFSLSDTDKAIALVGESGLGKTTIYKSLFSTYVNLWKDESEIEFRCNHTINGKTWNDKKILEGKVKPNFGFATQVPYFDSFKTAEENLFFPLKWLTLVEDSKIFRDAYLATFELTELKNFEMQHLSGGQRQIVNLARVFLPNPELVIIDESFSTRKFLNRP